jgi:multicomponent Na+:H+ antiporter subunit G
MIDTVGMSFILIGIAIYSGFSLDAIKILLIIIFIQIANPAITHILARAAMRSGLKPITGKEKPKK